MKQIHQNSCYDLVGVGIGPFNLSLAALLTPYQQTTSLFFDQREHFVWHEGMLLPEAYLQVPFLNDLVTLVDPTNPYSFLAFLAKNKRLYQFINANFSHVHRSEFNQYFAWASQNLPNLHFAEKIEQIEFKQDKFLVHTSKREVSSKNIVLGSGIEPHIPHWALGKLNQQLYHNHDFMHYPQTWKGKRIAIIGGGQSSAEIIYSILADSNNLPDALYWISRRRQFLPLDESPFVNEHFMPGYCQHFYDLPRDLRQRNLQEQKLTSEGISLNLLKTIYQRLYKLTVIDKLAIDIQLMPDHEATHLHQVEANLELACINLSLGNLRTVAVDTIILCTGYQSAVPNYLSKLGQYLIWEEQQFKVNRDYSLAWQGPAENRIYVQNAARHSHGIADPNLSLTAWRSAVIINSLLGKPVYDIDQTSSAFDWQQIYPRFNVDIELV